MPPLSPTVATSASPPPSGAGMGNRRLCLHGAPLLALLLPLPTLAQVIPTGTPTADILLATAIAEHRVYLTCSALDPVTHAQITENWQRDVAAATAILTAKAVPPDTIAAFTAAARPETLLPAPDTQFDDVKQLCDANPDWQTLYFQFNLTMLELELPKAFE